MNALDDLPATDEMLDLRELSSGFRDELEKETNEMNGWSGKSSRVPVFDACMSTDIL